MNGDEGEDAVLLEMRREQPLKAVRPEAYL
jgi:hypothetical protein